VEPGDVRDGILAMWRRNNDVTLYLLAQVPARGMKAVPAGSKGRDVTAQFAHLAKVRRGWVEYFTTGRYPHIPKYDKTRPPSKAALRKALATSGKDVETFLRRALIGDAKPKMFGGDPLRWCGYLIAHDASHRGQILLALKQCGLRLPEKISIEGIWGKWIYGK
jgi:uncharacterized damage-inducible protein DinB